MLKKCIVWPLLALNILVCVGFLCAGYSYLLPPLDYPILTLASYSFPFLAVGVIGFLLFWLFFKWKYALISFAALIVGYVPMHKYAPINLPQDEPKEVLKIITYNVHCFTSPHIEGDSLNIALLIDYLKKSDADIICLQEAYEYLDVTAKFKKEFKYVKAFDIPVTSAAVMCISKYPIEKVESLDYESKGNLSACYYVRYKGELLRVVNNHFESLALTPDDKEKFKSYIKGSFENDSSMAGSRRIFSQLKKATMQRQPEVEYVANFIGDDAKNTIVLGDFNDTPLSYCHHLIDQKLTDCYAACGMLMGYSYVNNGMFVRIDHTFCSSDFKPVKCYVDDEAYFSDHFPLITYLSRTER
ncbi:MAG: endonuclease/exonuclease/phosphatase family protein [Bacteroidaceae bacterium]|nr:endonuclease/exonuclease/phosphatase family protein [Bacteroidaceae bacterium]